MKVETLSLWHTYGEATGIQFRDAPNREFRISEAGWLALSGVQAGWLNYAYIEDSCYASDLIHEYNEVIRTRGGGVTVFLPSPTPPAIVSAASIAGWRELGTTPLMVYEQRGQPVDLRGFDVKMVESKEELRSLQELNASCFQGPLSSMSRIFSRRQLAGPGLTAYVAFRGGVAMSTVTVVQSGNLAGIFWMATPLQHRRQGAGWAALQFAITHCAARGVDTIYRAASDSGRPLYERMGFQTVAEVIVWEAGRVNLSSVTV